MNIVKYIIRNRGKVKEKLKMAKHNVQIRHRMKMLRYYKQFELFKYRGISVKDAVVKREERESAKRALQRTKTSRFVRGEDNAWYTKEEPVKDKDNDSGIARIMCMGDILCEEVLYKNSRSSEGFDFYPVYSEVKEILSDCDLSIANLESLIDEESPFTAEQKRTGGKYNINAPIEFLDAVKYAGIDFLSMANNHNLDAWISGIENTIKRVEEFKFMRTGLFMPGDRRYEIVVVKGIRIAILAYSTWYNKHFERLSKKGRKVVINEYSKEKVERDIAAAKAEGKADFVLVYMHWGETAEYRHNEGYRQKKMAKEIADAGADYIAGSHPHSLQGFDFIAAEDGRDVPVAYSLGNFVTSDYKKITRDNIILVIELKKKQGKVEAESKYIPCHTFDRFEGKAGVIVPLTGKSEIKDKKDLAVMKNLFNLASDILGKHIGGYGFDTPQITYYKVCDWLGLEKKQNEDTHYNGIRFAIDAVKGCLAIASNITSNPKWRPSVAEQYEMAEVARKKGAVAIITTEQLTGYNCIVVDDIIEAYITVVAKYRDYFSPKTIGITGSIGKTTTTEIIYTVLNSKFNTHRNTGSANSLRYCGNVIMQLKKRRDVYVQEIMEGPPFGTAGLLSKIVKPDVGVVTVVDSSHFEAFGSKERIWESCVGLQEGMPEGKGTMIINGDDPMQKKEDIANHKVVVYAIDNPEADVRADNIKSTIEGTYFDIIFEDRKIHAFMKTIGRHNVLNALAAFAAGKEYKMSDAEIVEALASYRTSGIRQNLLSYNGQYLYMDCYNSAYGSIVSTVAAIDDIEMESKKIAVIGDVLELGKISDETHRDIGKFLGGNNSLDLVIFYGKNSKLAFEECSALGRECLWTEEEDELVDLIKTNSARGDFILFKASHGMKLEYVADRIFGTWNHEEFQRYDYECKYEKTAEFKYTNYRDHITLTKYIGKASEVVIPDKIDGVPVSGIGASCFSNNKKIRKVHIPENIRNIRYCAFYRCSNLEEVKLPESLQIIGRSAFSTCSKLKKVQLGSNVTDIFFRAFAFCKNLESINIPSSSVYIDDEVFENCKKLRLPQLEK